MGYCNKFFIDGKQWLVDGSALITHDLTATIVLRSKWYGEDKSTLTFEYRYTPTGWERK